MPYKDPNCEAAIECRKRAQKKYYEVHKELCRKRGREYGKNYYREHKEECLMRNKLWRMKNRDKDREGKRKWREKNIEKVRNYCRINQRRWKERHPNYKRDKIRELRSIVLAHYGSKCAICGENHIEFLTIDHIYGGGNQHRKKIRGGTDGYNWIIKNGFPNDLQILCWNCNFAKEPKKYKEYYKKVRLELLIHYSDNPPKCACCGKEGIENLALDHIKGGGNKELRNIGLSKGGFNFYCWLRKQGYPEGYRVLCHNCNSALGLYGYCPHKCLM